MIQNIKRFLILTLTIVALTGATNVGEDTKLSPAQSEPLFVLNTVNVTESDRNSHAVNGIILEDLTREAAPVVDNKDSEDHEYLPLVEKPVEEDTAEEAWYESEEGTVVNFWADEEQDTELETDVIEVTAEVEEPEAAKDLSKFIRVNVASDGSYEDRLYNMLDYIPQNLKDSFFRNECEIHIDDQSCMVSADSPFSETMGYITGAVFGEYCYYEIHVSTKEEYIERSLAHEFGHYADYISGTPSQSFYFQSIMQEEMDNTNLASYFLNDPTEFFAQMCYEVIMDPYGDNVANAPKCAEYCKLIMSRVK